MSRIWFDRPLRAAPPAEFAPDDIALWTHPSPQRLRAIASGWLRTWERRVFDPDFLMIRLGLRTSREGQGDISVPATGPSGWRPVLVDLRGTGVVILDGPLPEVRALARALVSQVAVLHAPGDVDLMIRTAGDPGWDWAKWLPHTHQRAGTCDAGPGHAEVLPMVAAQAADLADLIDARLRIGPAAAPGHLIVVLDSYAAEHDWVWSPTISALFERAGPDSGITVVCLAGSGSGGPDPLLSACEPAGERLRVRLDSIGSMWLTAGDDPPGGEPGVADHSDVALAELTARSLAPLRLTVPPHARGHQPAGTSDSQEAQETEGLPGPLDLEELALGANGPHGLLTAADSRIRQELLRDTIAALASRHPPEQVNLLLADSGEDAGFADLAELPHIAGLVTGLAGNPSLVRRLAAVLDGERERRLGRPVPRLVVIVDDFWELAARHPGLADAFQRLAADGGNAGLHLLVGARGLHAGWLTGMAPHLSYRICLKTSSAAQSQLAIGTDDAFDLPSDAGLALLRTGRSAPRLVRTARAPALIAEPTGEPHRQDHPDTEASLLAADPPLVLPFRLRDVRQRQAPADLAPSADSRRAAMRAVVTRLGHAGRPASQIWLPPLPSVIPLDAVLGPAEEVESRGWQAGTWPGLGSLAFPVGLVDRPASPRQEPLLLDFGAIPGTLAIAGAPSAGKSTLLRALMTSAMLTHTPDELRFCCIDRGGGSLLPMEAAPHVASVAEPGATATAGRLLDEIRHLTTAREQLAAGQAPAGAGAYQRLPSAVFVLIDGWAALRHELPDADAIVGDLAARGPAAGVHLVLTADRWTDLAMLPPDAIGTRLELRLSDPSESLVSPELASEIGVHQPGRGLTPAGEIFQALVPRTDGRYTMDVIAAAHQETLAEIAASWPRIRGCRTTP